MPTEIPSRPDTRVLDGKLWHTLPLETALAQLGLSHGGLTTAEANSRRETFGPNELEEKGGRTVWHILWEQVSSVMIVILLIAGVLALLFKGGGGPPIDAIAIFSIVILFVVQGVMQEYRAQKAIAALKQMSSPTVKVVRDGQVQEMSARDLVPGDLVKLETGSVVPADCRIVESVNLRIQEAALTGESEPIEKFSGVLEGEDLSLGDRKNMGYMGTFASYGRGEALVVETGMRTELGKIASMIQNVKHEETPLQKKLDKLGKTLALIALVVAVVVALTGVYIEGKTWAEVLIIAIAISVAIVPEGLPAVQTFSLAIGAQRMVKRKALIRKLPAVEALGSVTVICSDKTGTLTQNKMTVTELETLDHRVELDTQARQYDIEHGQPELAALVACGGLCCDAVLNPDGETGVGDPTEVALAVAAHRYNLSRIALESVLPRVAEIPFDSGRKLMTTIHKLPEGGALPSTISAMAAGLNGSPYVVFTKGAADNMLAICDRVFSVGQVRPLTDDDRARIHAANSKMASDGIRVLGVGYHGLPDLSEYEQPGKVERELVFLGLVGMIDPARPEAKDAVAKCKTAGIRTIMITGDHPDTARYIAADLGITSHDGRVITGVELEKMSDTDLKKALKDANTNCFARVSPEHKLRIVGALQELGNIVAMTGDGVNDAPALKRADIGVAMGITGTDVSKEAADMVLLDDNFATIVAAIEEGRVVYDNLRRFVMFSISGNIAKVIIVAVSPLIGLAAMLKPIQILFSNLLTDGLLGLGMGMEAAEKNTMQRPPYSPQESIISRVVGRHIAIIGPVIGLLLLVVGYLQWQQLGLPNVLQIKNEAERNALFTDPKVLMWGTLMFTALAMMQVGRAFSSRSFLDPFWKQPLRTNKVLVGMILAVVTLQLFVVYTPGVQTFFSAVSLSGTNLGLCIAFAMVVLTIMELLKALERRNAAAKQPGGKK
ncbi:cation-translocating P-type ATPase [Chlorobium phaeobacteroides]|uniref:ATPase, P-type (Transporting), HAD superfamily, subfamily IC n=1 Tax=Chlorobium phaeobacteroides (strain DSM 266 / SMG 266 / 2430) TaxID=290317 RepID=A1BD81_CHLPD|nr:cation-translocating P-type ATPase [Chlorobium phaeobacteroides]ABL64358.1 ATPase, P-type (transporting), HAD superfamily, subfamily IC [Chlorobium phaeobacteroides DSM 266]